ncbi:dienelactone hydrolase family protein [uncultured Roseobacter sp.]|uniref:alpha/beta hydrolase n=1 Tax=uncultured Roseobacter sp. TaxID=114847 RepID=UPI00261D23D0|nr:dienelactone hydrolase family protein [uncultured Roseobacter sp.]
MMHDPHGQGRLMQAGAPLNRARLAVVMLHGRGGSPEDMLGLAEHLSLPDIAFVALEAAGRSWWPQSFLAPLADNEPGLSSGLGLIGKALDNLKAQGIGPERTLILGFSQGACLALEYTARNGTGLYAAAGLSGGLVGTGEDPGPAQDALYGYRPKQFNYDTRFSSTKLFIGCHERDPHIPLARLRTSQEVFAKMGAAISVQIYPGAGHGIVEDEIKMLRGLLNGPS